MSIPAVEDEGVSDARHLLTAAAVVETAYRQQADEAIGAVPKVVCDVQTRCMYILYFVNCSFTFKITVSRLSSE